MVCSAVKGSLGCFSIYLSTFKKLSDTRCQRKKVQILIKISVWRRAYNSVEKRDITLINKEAKEKWGQGGRYDNGLNRTVPASVLSTN